MKKLAALLLAACLALQPCSVPVIQTLGASGQSGIAAAQTGTNHEESALEIKVVSSSFFPYDGAVTVKVSGNGRSMEKTLQVTDNATARAWFQVPAGNYTVSISSKKFASYEQAVQVQEGWTHKIIVCPARINAGDGGVTGWIRPGDVNGDGTIDSKDQKELLKAVHEGLSDAVYDLNSDGSIDAADVKFLAESMDERQDSSVEKLWLSRDAGLLDGEIKSGSLAEFLWEGKPITAGPAGEGEVTDKNPITLQFTLSDSNDAGQVPKIEAVVIDAPIKINESFFSQIADGTAEVTYLDENGAEQIMNISLNTAAGHSLSALSVRAKGPSVRTESNGSLILDLGGQIAVKRVTIRIIGTTKKEQPLVEIARVEFVNHMEDRIAEPQLDIPSVTSVKPGNKSLTVSWKPQVNVTGYEVQVTGPVKNQSEPQTQIFQAADNTLAIASIHNGKLVNYKSYAILVRSVNGDWKSPWSQEVTGIPAPQEKPAPPDNVKAEGSSNAVIVSWKDMDDADGYMVYYKQTSAKDAEFQPVTAGFQQAADGAGKLETNKYTITGLLEHEEYSVYVVSWNELGWGKASLTASAVTKSSAAPMLPSYKLLNTSNGQGKLTAHILRAVHGGSGSMVDSPLDTEKNSALGMVDDSYASYWYKADWDDGVSYPALSKGVSVTLDADYQINYFTFAASGQTAGINEVSIQYGNSSDAAAARSVGARLIEKKDVNDNLYYIVKLNETVTADKIRMCLSRKYGNVRDLRIGEIHFHRYDSLEDDIMGLYTDVMHTTLRPDVSESVIQELEKRLNTADAESGETHPLYQELALELKTARDILNGNLDPSVVLSSQITAKKDTHLGFGGLNAWQPLGKTAYAGETLLVFVGHNTKRTGDSAEVQLVFTQYHAEAANVSRTQNLKIGRNEITVPQLSTTAAERGGQLYAAYTGNNSADQYAVRISGGSNIPVLNVYGMNDTERKQALQAYVNALESYVGTISSSHKSQHDNGAQNVKYDYGSGTNCILDATDIMMGQMMYSLPASQIFAGIKDAPDRAAKLDHALKAMEDAMTLFYHHKGLSSDAGTARGNNAPASQHLNIRYMRMFAGAFMYASGNHIGIEWGSVPGLASAENSKGFGWGIAHEIGHNINQGAYAAAEITNNYFSQLLTGTKRYRDENVYKKVTSGVKGRDSNVFTQLAMYWQLHLAYDNQADDHHIYGSYEDQFNNLFFARVDTYARNPEKAPQAGLSLNGGADQNLMRLACAAAGKNILAFFERWGMVPDADTAAYAAKYEITETKALYYVNEAARTYRLNNPDKDGKILDGYNVGQIEAAEVSAQKNKVTITIPAETNAQVKDGILGYEISRSMYKNGKKEETRAVGFQPIAETGDTVFEDVVPTINNRVMYYEVKAVDKFLNYSNPSKEAVIKIQTDGILDKTNWTVDTTMVSDDDKQVTMNDMDPDNGYDEKDPNSVSSKRQHSIDRIIDQDILTEGSDSTVYQESQKNPPAEAEITIDMHKTEAVTALQYQGSALQSVTVAVSTDGTAWKTVKNGYTGFQAADGSQIHTLWFDAVSESDDPKEKWVGTYDARYIRLQITKSGSAAIQEINICGPSGDDVRFAVDGDPVIGILKDNWQYGSQPADTISKGALIFAGTYKGNAAYNTVLIYDEKGNVIGRGTDGAEAKLIIMADNPGDGVLGETTDGIWIYYIEPTDGTDFNQFGIKHVRAELYRVDDAKKMEGERVVSDTEMVAMPAALPEITLTNNQFPGKSTAAQ